MTRMVRFVGSVTLAWIALAMHAQANEDTTSVLNADGTTTVTHRDAAGHIIDQSIVSQSGVTNRRTMMIFDKNGNCLSWNSADSHGKVDCGQSYVFETSGGLTRMTSLDGTLIYQKP